MSLDTLSWGDFLLEAREFLEVAELLGDTSWCLCKKNDEDFNTYLTYKQKILNCVDNQEDNTEELGNMSSVSDIGATEAAATSALDLLQIEYHIVYSISYQVPILYFRVYRSDGRIVGLADAWRLFRHANSANECIGANCTNSEMLSILTQMDHPILQKPFLALHPCRTSHLLAQAGRSRNRLLTFISVMGPFVQLNLRNEYGLAFDSAGERKKITV